MKLARFLIQNTQTTSSSNSIPKIYKTKFSSSSKSGKEILGIMGSVMGVRREERPKYEVMKSTQDYEIRRYQPNIVAEVTYDPANMKGDKDGGFRVLADYIGALGKPQNTKPEKIAMTAPVITQENDGGEAESIAMTAPVITEARQPGKKMTTMQFVLPGSKYKKVEDVPRPNDTRVMIREIEEKKYGVVSFNGIASDKVVDEKVKTLKGKLEGDGYRVIGGAFAC